MLSVSFQQVCLRYFKIYSIHMCLIDFRHISMRKGDVVSAVFTIFISVQRTILHSTLEVIEGRQVGTCTVRIPHY